jgi:hypothetical protein
MMLAVSGHNFGAQFFGERIGDSRQGIYAELFTLYR